MIHPARGAGHGSRARTVTSRTRARSPERAEPSFTDSHASPASARRDRRSRARLSPLHPSAVPTKGLAEDAHPIVRKSSTRLSGRALCPETRAVPARVARAHARSLVRSLAGAPVTHPRRTASASTTEPAAAPARTDQGFRDALILSPPLFRTVWLRTEYYTFGIAEGSPFRSKFRATLGSLKKSTVRGIFPRHVLKRHPRIHNSGFAPDSSIRAFLSEPLEARQRALGSRRAAYTHARVLFSPRGTPRSRWRSCRSRPRAASRARARDLDPRLARGFVPDPLVRGFVAPPREKHPADRSRLRSPPRSAGRRASRG